MNTLLAEAFLKIEKEENWCQIYKAADSRGLPVKVDSPKACAFCSIGAVKRLNLPPNEEDKLFTQLAQALPPNYYRGDLADIRVSTFNDTHHHSEVLALWRKAIESEA